MIRLYITILKNIIHVCIDKYGACLASQVTIVDDGTIDIVLDARTVAIQGDRLAIADYRAIIDNIPVDAGTVARGNTIEGGIDRAAIHDATRDRIRIIEVDGVFIAVDRAIVGDGARRCADGEIDTVAGCGNIAGIVDGAGGAGHADRRARRRAVGETAIAVDGHTLSAPQIAEIANTTGRRDRRGGSGTQIGSPCGRVGSHDSQNERHRRTCHETRTAGRAGAKTEHGHINPS
ncbi:MAG: hypothetical protein R3C97_11695 [Geminicoccaceae bacterium]